MKTWVNDSTSFLEKKMNKKKSMHQGKTKTDSADICYDPDCAVESSSSSWKIKIQNTDSKTRGEDEDEGADEGEDEHIDEGAGPDEHADEGAGEGEDEGAVEAADEAEDEHIGEGADEFAEEGEDEGESLNMVKTETLYVTHLRLKNHKADAESIFWIWHKENSSTLTF